MKNKKILSPLLLILFLAGVLLLILGLILNSRNERTGTDTEKKEAELACFLENSKGVGQAQVRLCLDKEGEIKGVAVICQGGNDPRVQAEVVRLLSAALGLSTNRIYVSGSS